MPKCVLVTAWAMKSDYSVDWPMTLKLNGVKLPLTRKARKFIEKTKMPLIPVKYLKKERE